jgi:hypothetical protein
MAGKHVAVYGIYPTFASVEIAVNALKASAFRNTDISVLYSENIGSKDVAQWKGETKAPEGAVAGAGGGAIAGGVLGWLASMGTLAIPGVGPLVAAGPLMAALAGAGVGGAVGGVAGALIGLGIPEHEAKQYEGRIKSGGILLSIHSDNPESTQRAREILERTGAQDIASAEGTSADYATGVRPVPRTGTGG